MSRDQAKRKTRAIETSIEIAAPLEAVWRALTDPEELTNWFPLEAGINEDGSLWMSWGGEFRFQTTPVLLEPNRRIRSVYRVPPPGTDPATLRPEGFVEIATDVTLETRGGKTLLRLVHSGFGADAVWDDLYNGTVTGWAFELRGLRHYLEKHRGIKRRVAWARVFRQCTREEAWARLMSPEALLVGGPLDGLKEGDRYEMKTVTNDEFHGVVKYHEPPHSFVATVENWNDAFLRIKLDDLYTVRDVNIFLSCYGVPEPDVRAFQNRWRQKLEQLFPDEA